ncbi:MAG: hypothetical protein ACJ763_02705 [Bdellovibrionia bacterium]
MRNLIRVSMALALCTGLSSCFSLSPKTVLTFNSAPTTAALQAAYAPGSTAGLKTVSQLGLSVAAVTNVPFSTKLMSNYEVIAPWLSSDGNATSMNSSMLMAITQFMAVACREMITSDAALADGKRWADNGINFTAGPQALASSGGTALVRKPASGSPDPGVAAIEQYTAKFWKRAATDAEFSAFSTALLNAIKDSSNFPMNTSAQDKTIGVLMVPCTMALSSSAFLLN